MGPGPVLLVRLSLVSTMVVLCRRKDTERGSQAWAEVQTLPPTGCVILGSYLTTLAFVFSFVKRSMAAPGYSESCAGRWS